MKGIPKPRSLQAIENLKRAGAKRKGRIRGPMPEETRIKISLATTGKKKTITKENSGQFKKGLVPTNGFKIGLVPWNKGGHHSPESCVKMSLSRRKKGQAQCKGSIDYKEWKKAVFERDKYICQDCLTANNLVAHHIITWKDNPELRFEVDNGRTLCNSCHGYLHGKINCHLPGGWNKGKKHSPETIEKCRQAYLKRKES
jgi:5-methylcytosine-specific restriction endonuclease McrA